MPGGSMPAVAAAVRFSLSALTLLTASLMAAAIRSSSISPSASADGSMRTRRASMRPDRVTLTMPPPDVPVTSTFASSSCARLRFSCIFWACCIIWAILPRMVWLSVVVGRKGAVRLVLAGKGPDGVGYDRGALVEQAADHRIVEEVGFGAGLAFAALALRAIVQRVHGDLRRRGLE